MNTSFGQDRYDDEVYDYCCRASYRTKVGWILSLEIYWTAWTSEVSEWVT